MNVEENVPAARSEAVYGKKWDTCISDLAIKVGSGLGLGIVFSVIFFRRRPWPVTLGAGVGFGMALSDCQTEFRFLDRIQGNRKKVTEDIKVESTN